MNLRREEANGKGALRGLDRRGSITDPIGIVLVLGATTVMAIIVWFKARGLPFKRARDGVLRR